MENNDIMVTKGDHGRVVIKLFNGDGTEFVPDEGDCVVLSVKRKEKSFLPVILKKEGMEIFFLSEETERLQAGDYCYDVTVTRPSGERSTVIKGKFVVGKVAHGFE